MYFHCTFIVIVVLGLLLKPTHPKPCKDILHELADKQMKAFRCFTVFARPVSVCSSCKMDHTEANEFFINLKNNCSDVYFDKDRLNLVQSTQNALDGIWNKAFCNDCFRTSNEPNMTIYEVFNQKSDDFNNCLNENKVNRCENCNSKYSALNSFFKELDEHNDGKVCFDMQDKMNQTRIKWSIDMKCCQRIADTTFFVVASTLISFLPVIFYAGLFITAKRRERNHELLQVNETEESGSR